MTFQKPDKNSGGDSFVAVSERVVFNNKIQNIGAFSSMLDKALYRQRFDKWFLTNF